MKKNKSKNGRNLGVLVWASALSLILTTKGWSLEVPWPDLSKPARAVGGGEHDAAVVVGVQGYPFVGEVPGAELNAHQWYEYLTQTRGAPPQNVKLLTGLDGTREEILKAVREAASQAGPDGTVWFVFIGHGAPSADGKDGLLVGVDAQQKPESLEERGMRRGEILNALGKSPARAIRVVLDACFSGRKSDGSNLAPGLQPLRIVVFKGAVDPRIVVLTAAKGDQFAGPLPGTSRPAFSYLVLGGLRGWAAGKDGKVTAGSVWNYTKNALSATLHGRSQTPDLIGREDALMGISAGETAPNLASLAEATSGNSAHPAPVTVLEGQETEGYRWAKACLQTIEILYVAETRSEEVPQSDIPGRIVDLKQFASDLKIAELTIQPFLKSKRYFLGKCAGLMSIVLEDMRKTTSELAQMIVTATAGHNQDTAKYADKLTDKTAHLKNMWTRFLDVFVLGTRGMLQEPKGKNGRYVAYDFTEDQRNKLRNELQEQWGDEAMALVDSNIKASMKEKDKNPLSTTAAAMLFYKFLSNPDFKFREKSVAHDL